MATIDLGSPNLELEDLKALSEPGIRIRLPKAVRTKIRSCRVAIERAVASGDTIYGVNTGFGKLAHVRIEPLRLGLLQRNLLLSHATGVGDALPREVSKLAFALRIHSLARGSSGVRESLIDAMVLLFNADLIPVIPSQGSVGASGDLAPLAHMALPLIGKGEVVDAKGTAITGAEALRRAGLEEVALAEKEGLALINGTQIMTAIAALALHQACLSSKAADICCATTIEALRASGKPFDARVHALRPHRGQATTAANVRALLAKSKIMASHANCAKVQDAYSMRCAPQVHGAVKDAIAFALQVVETEANSVTDNPLVMDDGCLLSAGNFHGQPVSQAMDFLAIGMATLANISERRIENLVNPDISGLPPFLAHDPGLESGFMIPQVVAAALASENKTLAHPASVDTIPTSANREDHVSMGPIAARHAAMVVSNTTKVLGIELLCACQGLDCGEKLRPGVGVEAAYAVLRAEVPPLHEDRFLAPDLRLAELLIASGNLVAKVERKVGRLAAC